MLGRAISELQEAQRTGHDRLLRMAADHENFKKRARREASDSMRRAEEKVVLEFLPILDNLERAVAHAQGTEAAVGGLLEGVRMVHKQFLAALERYEIRPFTSLGQPFDPERHEAIQQAPSPQPPGIICHEAQRGYLRGERLVRPAMVVVSIGPVTSAGSTAPAVEGSEGGASEASAAGSGTPETGQS